MSTFSTTKNNFYLRSDKCQTFITLLPRKEVFCANDYSLIFCFGQKEYQVVILTFPDSSLTTKL